MVPAPPYIAARAHGGAQKTINRIVIHGTVSRTVRGGARAIANYFATTAKTSAHYVVDPGEVIQCVYDHTIAWHDGTNTNSLGVELCDPVDGPADRWQDGPHQDMLRLSAALVRDLCLSYDIPMVKLTPADIRAGKRGICGHVDMRDAFPGSTTHYDPGPAFPWAQFMSLVTGGATTTEEDDLTPDQSAKLDAIYNQLTGSFKNGEYPGWPTVAGNKTLVDMVRTLLDAVLGYKPSRIGGDKNKTNLVDLAFDQAKWTFEDRAALTDLRNKVDQVLSKLGDAA